MGKSKALKQREKLVREGKLNPEIGRSPFSQFDLRTRKTKTKKEQLYSVKHKNHNSGKWEDDSFYLGKICRNRACLFNLGIVERCNGNVERSGIKLRHITKKLRDEAVMLRHTTTKLRDTKEMHNYLSTSCSFLSTSSYGFLSTFTIFSQVSSNFSAYYSQ
ncbi:hypothetical protein CIL05_03070 [Virgibacillus profundi]|uniref:Uncharacterized protein n=1 Tax=Virgibacillus profundi TaxID=2024555 RepID=A0A2A2IK61_9BACI|nr:hypothetical protein CIL05_03070 [Virgibacillus profundi]PXY55840.1 hypothetical protein CIT14_03080 [Virgibacillus profundi]